MTNIYLMNNSMLARGQFEMGEALSTDNAVTAKKVSIID